MPKRWSFNQLEAAVAAPPPPSSADYATDDDWWAAQDSWIAHNPGLIFFLLPPRGDAKRRKEWQRITKQHKRLLEAAAQPNIMEAAKDRAATAKAEAEAAAVAEAAEEEATALLRAGPAGWLWDDEWQCYFDPQAAEAQETTEAQMQAESNQMKAESDAAEVREWLHDLISELLPPTYSQYELDRQHTIVSNNRILLSMARAALYDAEACSGSSAHCKLSHLRDEVRKAKAAVEQSECQLDVIAHNLV